MKLQIKTLLKIKMIFLRESAYQVISINSQKLCQLYVLIATQHSLI